MSVARAALICASVPESVSVPLPFAPAEIVAPPARLTVRVPWAALTAVVARLPSLSLTLMPAMAVLEFHSTDTDPGTELTGASLTATTSMVATAVLESRAPSVTLTVTTRSVVSGLAEVLSNVTDSMASAYCAFDATPEKVMISPLAPDRVHEMPPGSTPLLPDEPPTSSRSPLWKFVSAIVAPVRLALPAKMELSTSAMATAAPPSV